VLKVPLKPDQPTSSGLSWFFTSISVQSKHLVLYHHVWCHLVRKLTFVPLIGCHLYTCEQITNRSAVSVEYRVRLGSEPIHLTSRTQLTTSFQHADHVTTQPVIGWWICCRFAVVIRLSSVKEASVAVSCINIVTGPHTHSVGGQTGNGCWYLSSSSVGFVTVNTPQRACRRLYPHRPGDDVMPPPV